MAENIFRILLSSYFTHTRNSDLLLSFPNTRILSQFHIPALCSKFVLQQREKQNKHLTYFLLQSHHRKICLIYDIFYCNWVATQWQLFSTHIHTNNTENVTKQTVHKTTQKYIEQHKKYIEQHNN